MCGVLQSSLFLLPPVPWRRLGSLGGQALTFPLHARGQALLIAAVLTAVPLALVHCAVLVVPARVGQVLANGAFEEAFAALSFNVSFLPNSFTLSFPSWLIYVPFYNPRFLTALSPLLLLVTSPIPKNVS